METLRHVSDTIRIQICVMVSVLAHDRWVELLARFMSEWIWSFTKKVPRHCLHLRLTTTSSHCISCAEETAVLPERDVSGETSVHTSLTPPPPQTTLHWSCQHIRLARLSLKNTRAFSVMWVTPAISRGPSGDVTPNTPYKQPLIDVADIRMSNRF